MVKVWFPNMFMRLVSNNMTVTPAVAKLKISPKMTKTEVKEYLTKIYNVDVVKVDTANFLGKYKRLRSKRREITYKQRDFKMAYVSYNNTPTPTA